MPGLVKFLKIIACKYTRVSSDIKAGSNFINWQFKQSYFGRETRYLPWLHKIQVEIIYKEVTKQTNFWASVNKFLKDWFFPNGLNL